ncbi:MAG: Na(+)/H(+) antiporter subunit B [Rubrobacteraceae bacterium]
MTAGLVFDGLLALALPLLTWRVLVAKELFTSVVLFIALGLLISLAYVRLAAPDVALAEAAIGAGVTGALLLDTLARIGEWRRERRDDAPSG